MTTLDLPRPAEQFEDLAQQRESATLGMWVFIAGDVLFFGTIFIGFGIMRRQFPHNFAEGAHELKWWLGGINTAALLISSYFMAAAVHTASLGRGKATFRLMMLTVLLALVFFGIKIFEYSIDYHEHLIPSINYSQIAPDGTTRGQHLPLFMSFYFFATLLHALHVLIGVVLLSSVAVRARRGRFSPHYYTPVEIVGLYWHFVDLVWIFLYPTLYLLRHP